LIVYFPWAHPGQIRLICSFAIRLPPLVTVGSVPNRIPDAAKITCDDDIIFLRHIVLLGKALPCEAVESVMGTE